MVTFLFSAVTLNPKHVCFWYASPSTISFSSSSSSSFPSSLLPLQVKDDFYSFGLPWLVADVAEVYPTDYNESMNTVLTQVCALRGVELCWCDQGLSQAYPEPNSP